MGMTYLVNSPCHACTMPTYDAAIHFEAHPSLVRGTCCGWAPYDLCSEYMAQICNPVIDGADPPTLHKVEGFQGFICTVPYECMHLSCSPGSSKCVKSTGLTTDSQCLNILQYPTKRDHFFPLILQHATSQYTSA